MDKTNTAGQNDNKMNETDSLSFLLGEYNQCYEHMRHYDNTRLSLAEFALSFYSIIATIVFAILEYYSEKMNNYIYLEIGLFLFFVSFSGFLIINMLAQNRADFVKVARQVNSIRKELIALNRISFKNFLYVDSFPNAYNSKSTHILLLYFVSFVNAVFFSFAIFFILSYLGFVSLLIRSVISILAFIIVFSLE
ncbi:MAG TPA: hypothetical protein VF360_01465, partial [Candidatus Methanoperedens sp.]